MLSTPDFPPPITPFIASFSLPSLSFFLTVPPSPFSLFFLIHLKWLSPVASDHQVCSNKVEFAADMLIIPEPVLEESGYFKKMSSVDD